ncbi:hypothetical protein OV203_25580 [Nannocystis sp. ILAH1]|uniref:hypothetical protein n=1 Tax=Nannocystis sp. ILAH1 TaxID=2996789 RepID=UPI00226DEC32|nr:hypothetical protein [Nannocystis sp. ILAH1]MCY0990539.1 hypothetical protein [Nannocystis sp. ILAH1]
MRVDEDRERLARHVVAWEAALASVTRELLDQALTRRPLRRAEVRDIAPAQLGQNLVEVGLQAGMLAPEALSEPAEALATLRATITATWRARGRAE